MSLVLYESVNLSNFEKYFDMSTEVNKNSQHSITRKSSGGNGIVPCRQRTDRHDEVLFS